MIVMAKKPEENRPIFCFFHWKMGFLFALFFGSVFSALAVEFEVEGNAVYDLYSGHSLEVSRTNFFVVSVRDGEWRIVTGPLDSSNRLESAKDADCLRTVNTEFRGGTNSNRVWSNVALIQPRDRPSLENPFLQTLWLTYCSSAYFQSVTNDKIEPIWPLDNPLLSDAGFTLSGKWFLNETPPHLPVELIYLNDGIYRGYNYTKKEPKEIKLPPPYNTGYTCAVFTATSITNLNGSSVPLGFYFKTSQTPLGGHTPDMPRDVMFGEVKTIKAHSSVDVFRPAYQGEVSIHDYCIVEKMPKGSISDSNVMYKAYNGDWPEGEKLEGLVYKYIHKVALLKADDEKASAKKADLALLHRHRLVVLVFFFLTTCLPIVLLFFMWRKKRIT